MGEERGRVWVIQCRKWAEIFLVLLANQLVIERVFEYNESMEVGDPSTEQRQQAFPWMWPSTPSMTLSAT